MKKPIKKNYCSAFSFDKKLTVFNSKQFAKDAAEYIEYQEQVIKRLKKQLAK